MIHKSGFRRGFSDHFSPQRSTVHFAIEFANLSEVDLGQVHMFCSHALLVNYGLGHKQTDVFTHCITSLAMGATFLGCCVKFSMGQGYYIMQSFFI